MKVVVFGATGTIGRLVAEKMVTQGHTVTAFTRKPDRLKVHSTNLRQKIGDATDPAHVEDAIIGQDAVIVVLGAGASRSSHIRSEGTMNVICAMQKHGVDRLVCQSTLGAHESWGNLNFFWKRIMFGAVLKPVLKDHELQEKLVRVSGLEWTIVRPSAFTDEPETGAFQVGFGPEKRNLSFKISRSDVAAFLIRQLSDLMYVQRAVSVSN